MDSSPQNNGQDQIRRDRKSANGSGQMFAPVNLAEGIPDISSTLETIDALLDQTERYARVEQVSRGCGCFGS